MKPPKRRLLALYMKKEHTYVECKQCDNWIDEFRISNLCKVCNNSRLMIDPNELLCNLCGETVCPIGTMNEVYPHGLYNAKVTGGYESYHLSDMTSYTFSFCEKCLRNLFMKCKIKPLLNVSDIDFGGSLAREQLWEDDQSFYEFRVWEDAGGRHQAYVDGKCNAVKDCDNKALYTKYDSYKEFTEDCSCEEHKNHLLIYAGVTLVKFIPNNLKAFL